MMSQCSPAGSWFVDIRKAALIACIAALLDLSIPTWSLSHSMLARASIVTRVAVIAGGLWLAFNVVRLAYVPFIYPQIRSYALYYKRTPPRLWDMMAEAVRFALGQACLFAAPFIVWRSGPHVESAPPEDDHPDSEGAAPSEAPLAP
jgi:hypothetical protein